MLDVNTVLPRESLATHTGLSVTAWLALIGALALTPAASQKLWSWRARQAGSAAQRVSGAEFRPTSTCQRCGAATRFGARALGGVQVCTSCGGARWVCGHTSRVITPAPLIPFAVHLQL